MKATRTIFSIICLTISLSSFGQFETCKDFDPSIFDNKVLYIPSYEQFITQIAFPSPFQKSMKKEQKKLAEMYVEAWTKGLAESYYDATDYEIVYYNWKNFNKNVDPNAAIMFFQDDTQKNRHIYIQTSDPYLKTVVRAVGNDLDFFSKNDVRLFMNLINETIKNSWSSESSFKPSAINQKKYKDDLIELYDNLKEMTFLVPRSTRKNPDKAAQKDKETEEALKSWSISKVKLATQDEIDKKRLSGESDYFYLHTIKYHKNLALKINYNLLLSTEYDNVLFAYTALKRLTPERLLNIQSKLKEKVEQYKLEKK